MFYKIVVIPGSQPDNPIVQRGEFVRREEPPVLTALATEYGDPDKLAVQCLQEWSGGEVDEWLDDLDKDTTEFQFPGNNCEYYVFVSEHKGVNP
jgi:hypothetical protein